MAMIITVPHLTNAVGISPNRFLAFLERNSILL